MKVNRLVLNLLAQSIVRSSNKRNKGTIIDEKYKEFLNIPYIDDGDTKHMYDVYKADDDKRNNICIIDIHGGAYMFGDKKHNYKFGLFFLDKGFDFIAIDYIPNKGKRDTSDIVSDCMTCIEHIYNHRSEYGLENSRFVLTGDSAGGHLALLMSEMLEHKEIGKELGLNVPDFVPVCTLVNCPAYDYETLGEGLMTKGARKRMFGSNIDPEYMRKYSPKTYIKDFSLPLLLSSCKNDFVGAESKKLDLDMKEKNNVYKYVYIDSDNPEVDHVHNVIKPDIEESVYVNSEMVKFILEN